MKQPVERRFARRADIDVYLDEVHFCGRQLGRTLDISPTGIRYLTNFATTLRRGREVLVEFCLPDNSQPIRTLGRVVGSFEEPLFRSTSVRFTRLRPRDLVRICTYIERQRAA